MKLKKIPYYLLILFLTAGPSIVIGFLSFGGMLALSAFLPLAIGALVLSMAYEAEIYSQNIKSALNKLFFKHNYTKRELANRFLLDNFPNLDSDNCPEFFKDYEILEKKLAYFGDKPLQESDEAKKKLAQKALKDAEKWFAEQLFLNQTDGLTPYQQSLQNWLKHNRNKEQAIAQLNTRRYRFHAVKLFSIIAGIFMGLGTIYLLLEGFAAIPLLAAIPLGLLPVIILPLAINAGIAYIFLIYNATTSMIHNDTLRRWYFQIRDSFRSGITVPKIAIALLSVVLTALAVALTICTAGTWWTVGSTVINNAGPLLNWLSHLPRFIMGVINPIVTGISALIFNVENTHEAFTILHDLVITDDKKAHDHHHDHHHKSAWQKLRERENWLQLINPARIVLLLTITPLRILMFFGHLISIGVTADRVPGISEIASAILGIISEGFEDLPYFYDPHHHGHSIEESRKERLSSASGHDHNTDVPTIVLKIAFGPIYLLASLWAWGASQLNKKPLSLKHAFFMQIGFKIASDKPLEKADLPVISHDWKQEQLHFVIERQKQKLLDNLFSNIELTTTLNSLQEELRKAGSSEACETIITKAKDQLCHKQHSFFSFGKTPIEECLEGLAKRAGVA